MRFKCGDYAYHKADSEYLSTKFFVYGVAEAEIFGNLKEEMILVSNHHYAEKWQPASFYWTDKELEVIRKLNKANNK